MIFKKMDKHMIVIGIIPVSIGLITKMMGGIFYIEWKYLDFAAILLGFYLSGVYLGAYLGIYLGTNDLLYRGIFHALVQAVYIFWFLSNGKEKIDSVLDLQNDFSTLTFVILYIAFPVAMISAMLYEALRHSPAGKFLIRHENVPEKMQNTKKKK